MTVTYSHKFILCQILVYFGHGGYGGHFGHFAHFAHFGHSGHFGHFGHGGIVPTTCYLCLISRCVIFFLDKDFDYINVIEDIFTDCLVFLCFIHTRRYFKDKVLTGTSQWTDSSFLSGGDKEELLKQVTLVRDSPNSEAIQRENVNC
jgi:hypothetical protein